MDPLRFDPSRTADNARQAETEDLLDRVTFYRAGMQLAALEIIEAELRARGVTPEQIGAYLAARQDQVLWLPDGTAVECSFCRRPAVAEHRGWYRLWGLLPVFPSHFYYCDGHGPALRPTELMSQPLPPPTDSPDDRYRPG